MTRVVEHSYGVIPVKKVGDSILFLLVLHRIGHWDFPKGRVNAGESDPVATALRELEEEGCVSECRLLPDVWFEDQYVSTYNDKDYDKTVRYFLGVVMAESPPHDDPDNGIIERRWVSYEEAMRLLTYPRKKEIATLAMEYFRQSE